MTANPPQQLWNRNFVGYWLGIALTALGDALLFIALPFLVLDLTDSPRALATVVLLATLPRFLGPLTGALADRLHLRVPLLIIALLRAGLFASIALLAIAQVLPLWLIYAAAPFNGLLTSFTFAAGMVLVPNLVPRSELARANSLMQAALMGIPLVGLGVAGALVGAVGSAATILIASPCLLALAASALSIEFPSSGADRSSFDFVGDVLQAGRFLLTAGPLAFLLVMTIVLNASLNLLNVLMPVAMTRLGRGAQGFGLFEALVSAGLLLGIVAVTLIGNRIAPRYQISMSLVLMAVGFAVLAQGSFPAFLVGGVVLGTGLGLSEVAAVTLLQLAVPDGMRGKVLGIIFTANAVGLTAGAGIAGLVVERVSVDPVYAAASGFIGVLAVAWTLVHIRGREGLERLMEAAA